LVKVLYMSVLTVLFILVQTKINANILKFS